MSLKNTILLYSLSLYTNLLMSWFLSQVQVAGCRLFLSFRFDAPQAELALPVSLP